MSTAPALWRSRGVAAWLLWPLSLLFRLVSALRRAAFRAGLLRVDRLPVPVIVVGNIIAGGAGKTPLTLYLARALAARGWRPLIVTRGYGGRADAVHEVDARADVTESGDEPVLLARRSGLPVWVGRRRADAARAGLAAHPDCDLVLCDDGLQHYALARDVEIAVLDRRGVMNGFHLPAGPLREPPARLRTVDAVVLNGLPTPPEGVRTAFRMGLHGARFYRLDRPEQQAAAADLAGLRLHAIAGIGEPARFFDHLRALGLEFVAHPFPDHHVYSAQDLTFSGCDALLLTEKDAVKCHGLSDTPMWVLPVEAHLDPDLAGYIATRLAELKHGSTSS
ncbi:MAG: tetraacyldisaccharide 4'-kinase [Methyloversatilis discipulorum]|uniref:tetraacyldisaccharide 4'-kinase n=1 Tax=Methyloversatilis discipulorum TaxID=1119528 RepID=UPI0026F148A2|nr:tetraacyldisaccharide 4'-kinase [Methyloversatilis discipulorum]MBT9517148.1 tetraacyldisaccharide 4'-kinase [Methyloversatilis discipulorum]